MPICTLLELMRMSPGNELKLNTRKKKKKRKVVLVKESRCVKLILKCWI